MRDRRARRTTGARERHAPDPIDTRSIMSTSVTCHLVRSDGSRWIVTEYRQGENGVTVCAVREIEEHAGGGDGEGRAATM